MAEAEFEGRFHGPPPNATVKDNRVGSNTADFRDEKALFSKHISKVDGYLCHQNCAETFSIQPVRSDHVGYILDPTKAPQYRIYLRPDHYDKVEVKLEDGGHETWTTHSPKSVLDLGEDAGRSIKPRSGLDMKTYSRLCWVMDFQWRRETVVDKRRPAIRTAFEATSDGKDAVRADPFA